MLWRCPEWNSAARAGPFWGAGKTAIWHLKNRFYGGVLDTFAKGRWVQAPKELTLSVLKTLVEVFRQAVAQHAGKGCWTHRGGFIGYRLCRRSLQYSMIWWFYDFHRFLWIFRDFQRFTRVSMDFHRFSSIFMDSHGLSPIFIDFYRFSCVFISFHGFSWIL